MPKRYFDIPESRLVVELDMTAKGMQMTLEEIEKETKIQGLREVSYQEYKALKDEYTGRQKKEK